MANQILRQVALVSETPKIHYSELARVGAALQKQMSRDFGPIWDVDSTVDAFDKLEDVPLGYWPMIVRDKISYAAAGIHLDTDNQPMALITYSPTWSLTASHEALEMLADPFGNRLIAGDSPKPKQGRVEFLVEVSDPSEAEEFGYKVNGILVSDFYTPSYFDPIEASGVRYSFTGAIKKPRQVLKGGYLSWHDPVSDHWWQEMFLTGAKSSFVDIGVLKGTGSLRSMIDRRTNPLVMKALETALPKKKPTSTANATKSMMTGAAGATRLMSPLASSRSSVDSDSSVAKAKNWRLTIKDLLSDEPSNDR